jgi:hypothetical protein
MIVSAVAMLLQMRLRTVAHDLCICSLAVGAAALFCLRPFLFGCGFIFRMGIVEMKHTRSRRRVRRVTRRKGAGLRQCIGKLCGYKYNNNENKELNKATEAAVRAESVAAELKARRNKAALNSIVHPPLYHGRANAAIATGKELQRQSAEEAYYTGEAHLAELQKHINELVSQKKALGRRARRGSLNAANAKIKAAINQYENTRRKIQEKLNSMPYPEQKPLFGWTRKMLYPNTTPPTLTY